MNITFPINKYLCNKPIFYTLLPIKFIFAVMLILSACADDIHFVDNNDIINDNPVRVLLKVDVADLQLKSEHTRAEVPSTTKEDEKDYEKRIDNLWIFQFGYGGALLISPIYYTIFKFRKFLKRYLADYTNYIYGRVCQNL